LVAAASCHQQLFPDRSSCHSRLLRPPALIPPDQLRTYSDGRRPGFFQIVIDNLKSEYEKNKDMQDSLKKFREEAAKLEESEALKEARRKFESIEGETSKTQNVIKQQFESVSSKVKESVGEAAKANEALKKAGETIGKTADDVTKVVSGAAESIGKSGAFQAASSSAANIKDELESNTLGGRVYKAPPVLRKRREALTGDGTAVVERIIEVNEEATGVELHKDSKFFASWQQFKDNNPMANKITDIRVKYEESDNPLVRGARIVTDKLQDIMGGLFTQTELSVALTEIIKMDPNFCKEEFLKDCERDIIPNVLEAMVRGDLEILQDWCFEAPFNILATPIRQAQQLGYFFDSKVLDVEGIDLLMGKILDQGPVLVLQFQSQQIMCVRNAKGEVVEGDPDKVMRVIYIWVLCRDQAEMDPKAAWRLLELSAQSQEQFL